MPEGGWRESGSPVSAAGRREAQATASVAARVLGGFELLVDGRTVARTDWQRLSAERLVKLLLVTPGHRVTREAAAETLWPDAPPGAGRTNVRKALHFATHALEGSGLVKATDEAIALDPERLDLDLDRLQAAFDALDGPRHVDHRGSGAARGGPGVSLADRPLDAAGGDGDRAAAFDVVLDLGSKELLPDDLFEDWLVGPRERIATRWQRLALPAARREADAGHAARALDIVSLVLERDPTDEAAHRLAIELYAREGRHHAARRQYALCRQALRAALDADPSPETTEAFARAERSVDDARGLAPVARLVARHAELQRVEILLDLTAGGHLASLVIHGPAGIGKTRLLQEVVAYARAADWNVIDWQAVEASRSLAFAPFRIGLVRLVDPVDVRRWPEPARSAITTLAPGVGRGSLRFAAQDALVTGLVAAVDRVTGDRPLLIAVDDVAWLDDPSKEVLRAVASGLPDRPILLAVTFRDDERSTRAEARPAMHAQRDVSQELALAPLAARDMERLILEHLGGESVGPDLLRWAYELSGGNPLFCLELVRLWQDDGRVRLEDGRWVTVAGGPTGDLPATVRRLVEQRTADLPAPAREIVAVAAEMGPEFTFGQLAAASSAAGESVIEAIDTAIECGLLVEQGSGYAFAHPLYRLAVRASAGPARRDGMRRRIAGALAGVDPDATPADLLAAAAATIDPAPAAEQALAAAEAGDAGARPMAVAFGLAAGERARALFDRASAITFLQRALDAWGRLPAGLAAAYPASGAYTSLVDLHTHGAAADAAATRAFRDAVRTARDADEVAAAYAARFWIPYRHGDFAGAIGILDEGLRGIPPDAHVARARLLSHRGWCLYRLRRLDDALPALADVLAILEASPDRRCAMQTLDYLGCALKGGPRADEGIGHLERSLRLAYELGDSRGELLAEIHLTSAFTRAGRAPLARPHLTRAIELARLVGDRYAEAVATWSAADLEDLSGDLAAAASLRRRELSLLAAIGGNAQNEALAHAHLANIAWRLGDEDAFSIESAEALRLAARSDDTRYGERIGGALRSPEWWRLEA
jgi:DNA-binding SARP family transcriptional activator/tetratricopeptide (TPR) repeat protein